MVDYNKQKTDTIKIIDAMIVNGSFTAADISFHILKTVGFGQKFVQKYINEAILRGFVYQDQKTGILKMTESKKASKKENKKEGKE